MSDRKIHQAHFSPTGTTRSVVEAIAREIGTTQKVWDLLRDPPKEDATFGSDTLFVAGLPVYAGRVPELCLPMLAKFKGNGAPAIAAVVYGNRDYDDALLELKNILEAQGFKVIGAAAFVAQHSIFPSVGKDRPDAEDFRLTSEFANRCLLKLESFAPGAARLEAAGPDVKGKFPYKQPGAVPLKPSGDRKCIRCGACASICPAGAIDEASPMETDKKRCISCAACIAACPVGARAFRGFIYRLAARVFKKKCAPRREPEFFV